MAHKLRAALTLSLPDWAVFLQAWTMLLIVDLGLRLLPFPRVQKLAAFGRRANDAKAADAALELRRLDALVDITARNHLYAMTCLRQALTLQWLLARRGIAADLRIGVRREGRALEAHAWVECAGQVEARGVQDYFTPLVAVVSE